ncbi:unnamed protein product [Camellia sinensis]
MDHFALYWLFLRWNHLHQRYNSRRYTGQSHRSRAQKALRFIKAATLGETLGRYRKMPRVYIGCMKSGPALAQKGARYHEPKHWKFGEMGNKYFCHAT